MKGVFSVRSPRTEATEATEAESPFCSAPILGAQ
jgi:hypothetical protein